MPAATSTRRARPSATSATSTAPVSQAARDESTAARTERVAPAVPPTAPSRTLDVFDNPAPERDYLIEFVIPEFTCVCPLTGQPDFAHFTIEMVADKVCIELKSLKLYFWSYRDTGAFHEKVTNAIADDIVRIAAPRYLRIVAKWNVRGGIYTNVVVEHRKEKWKPQEGVLPPSRR